MNETVFRIIRLNPFRMILLREFMLITDRIFLTVLAFWLLSDDDDAELLKSTAGGSISFENTVGMCTR